MKVLVENTYEDGHEFSVEKDIDEPAALDEQWWEEVAWNLTGGYCESVGCTDPDCEDGSQDACYNVTIVTADNLAFVGETREWV